jgi:beta-xylosidase
MGTRYVLCVLFSLLCYPLFCQIRSGTTWFDARHKVIDAHCGNIIYHEGVYYWYGEHKIKGLSEKTYADGGVHCYASNDFMKWYDQGMMISLDSVGNHDLIHKCILERPKVVYNANLKKFVIFFKFYLKEMGYDVGYVGVATSLSPVGPFVYSHKFLGGNSANGTGDFAMFKDDDGSLYHIAVQKPSKKLVISKMTDDYMMPAEKYSICEGIEYATEAPALLKKNGIYYMIGSASTGWKPNAARSYSSKSLKGPWKSLGNPLSGINPHNGLGPELSYGGQSSFIFKMPNSDNYVAMFDIHKPEHPFESLYIWLPLKLVDGKIRIEWIDEWNTSIF